VQLSPFKKAPVYPLCKISTHGSQVWRPYLLKNKSHSLSLQLLPLMMFYELNDILFFVKSFDASL